MKHAYVVSDLHMFCRRSDWHHFLPEMHQAAEQADLFVFNGDTFDFKWSTTDVSETVKLAEAFLENFCKKHPHCQFHVNLGNHDHVPELMEALEALSKRLKNLTWHPYYLRVGNSVFLHGDVANWRPGKAATFRLRSQVRLCSPRNRPRVTALAGGIN